MSVQLSCDSQWLFVKFVLPFGGKIFTKHYMGYAKNLLNVKTNATINKIFPSPFLSFGSSSLSYVYFRFVQHQATVYYMPCPLKIAAQNMHLNLSANLPHLRASSTVMQTKLSKKVPFGLYWQTDLYQSFGPKFFCRPRYVIRPCCLVSD